MGNEAQKKTSEEYLTNYDKIFRKEIGGFDDEDSREVCDNQEGSEGEHN